MRTPTQQVTVETGTMVLLIPDVKTPQWYGDYHNGKLAIYVAEVKEGRLPDSVTVIAIYNSEPGEDFIITSSYEEGMSFEDITAHILANVFISYIKSKSSVESTNTYVPGPTTPQ